MNIEYLILRVKQKHEEMRQRHIAAREKNDLSMFKYLDKMAEYENIHFKILKAL